MRKNNFSVFFGIFLVSMLFVPPSMPAEAQDVLCFGAIIDLNKVYFSPTDDVEILITAPDFNKKPNAIAAS